MLNPRLTVSQDPIKDKIKLRMVKKQNNIFHRRDQRVEEKKADWLRKIKKRFDESKKDYIQDVLNVQRELIEEIEIDWAKVEEHYIAACKIKKQRQRDEFLRKHLDISRKINNDEVMEIIKDLGYKDLDEIYSDSDAADQEMELQIDTKI